MTENLPNKILDKNFKYEKPQKIANIGGTKIIVSREEPEPSELNINDWWCKDETENLNT